MCKCGALDTPRGLPAFQHGDSPSAGRRRSKLQRTGRPARTVREFVAEFRGLSATGKQKVVTEGWAGKRLHDFIVDGDLDPQFVKVLLTRMQEASSAPPAKALGTIGKQHMTSWMVEHDVAPESIRYQQKSGIDGLPYVLEIAFGVNNNDSSERRIITCLNWSPV